MTGMEKKLAFLLATSPHLDTLSGSYDEAARDLVANGVVPVVRCKDCKHSRERNEYEKNYLVEGVRVCTRPECSDDCWYATWPDHWCSYGERRAYK
jgi:hypothetical protein